MLNYVNAVEAGSMQRYGVGFLAIADDLFGGNGIREVLAESIEKSLAPNDFLDAMGRDFGLVDGDAARNRYQAALVAYLREIEGWEIGPDGTIVAQRTEGVMALSVERRGAEMVFVAGVAEGVEMNPDGTIPDGTTFREVAAAGDIHLALEAYKNDFVPGRSGPGYA